MKCDKHGAVAWHSGVCWMCEPLEERKARLAKEYVAPVVQKKQREKQVLPVWMQKTPNTKKQKAEMIAYCRQMKIPIPDHLL